MKTVCSHKLWKKRYKRSQRKPNYYFEGQSESPQHWFDIDLEWLETNFKEKKPDFYKHIFNTILQAELGHKFHYYLLSFKKNGQNRVP